MNVLLDQWMWFWYYFNDLNDRNLNKFYIKMKYGQHTFWKDCCLFFLMIIRSFANNNSINIFSKVIWSIEKCAYITTTKHPIIMGVLIMLGQICLGTKALGIKENYRGRVNGCSALNYNLWQFEFFWTHESLVYCAHLGSLHQDGPNHSYDHLSFLVTLYIKIDGCNIFLIKCSKFPVKTKKIIGSFLTINWKEQKMCHM